jgi:hypothetical protein
MKHLVAAIVGFLVLILGGRQYLGASNLDTLPSIDSQMRAFATPGMLHVLQSSSDLQIRSLPADLDGSGKYDYLVALYEAPSYGAKLRLLHESVGQLRLAGSLSQDDNADYSSGSVIELKYVDNSGIPVIEVQSYGVNGRHYSLDLVKWDGSRLVSLLPGDSNFTDAYLSDPEGSGVPEVIEPPYCEQGKCVGDYRVFRFKNGHYSLISRSATDPSGLIPPIGESSPLPGIVTSSPDKFSVTEILAPTTTRGAADVIIRLGNLAPSEPQVDQTDVADINVDSIYAGQSLKPLHVQIVGAQKGKAEGFDGSFLEITLSRVGVLRYLAKADPSGRPVTGDVLTLPVYARLKNGLALYGLSTIKIGDANGK